MSGAQHTPGPWVDHHLEVWDAPVDNDEAIMVAKVVSDSDNMMDPVALADARLIATAPTLLELIEREVFRRNGIERHDLQNTEWRKWLDQARAAISRVKVAR